MIKAISFDIGGTLIKPSEDEGLIQQLSMLSAENIEVVKLAYKEHFLTRRISIEEFCKKTSITQTIALDKIAQYYESKKPPVIWEDVPRVLEQLKRANIVLITISNKSYMNPFNLNSYGLEPWFAQEIYSCDIGCAKPHISIFRYAQQFLQMKPYEIIHVGDSYVSDYLGARKVRWNSVLLNRCYDHIPIQSNIFTIESLYDFPYYLQAFSGTVKLK